MSPKTADSFIETGADPAQTDQDLSPDRLRRGLESVTEALNRKGYESAQAAATQIEQNDLSGHVDLVINVRRASFHGSVPAQRSFLPDAPRLEFRDRPNQRAFFQAWMQDLIQALRATNYHQGYPDVSDGGDPAAA